MPKRELKIYITISIIQLIFTIIWTLIFKERFPYPVFSCMAAILFSHLFFLFGYFGPRLGFEIAHEKDKLIEQMAGVELVIFLCTLSFGIGGIFLLIKPIIDGEPEKVMFFSIPMSLSLGAYSSWKLIKNTLNNGS